jgi:hypothetical protein
MHFIHQEEWKFAYIYVWQQFTSQVTQNGIVRTLIDLSTSTLPFIQQLFFQEKVAEVEIT